MSADPETLVRKWIAVWPAADRDTAKKMVATDFHFTSPLDNRIDRQTFFERCWPAGDGMKAKEIIRAVVDSQTVLVTYEATSKEGKRFRNTEAITFAGEQVIEVEDYFG